MRRLLQAPNLALATLWVDMLGDVGIAATVQRAYASGIAGEIPPDQSLPEIWLQDDTQHTQAAALLHEWRHAPHRHWVCQHRHWVCQRCHEAVDGPFEACWNCGQMRAG